MTNALTERYSDENKKLQEAREARRKKEREDHARVGRLLLGYAVKHPELTVPELYRAAGVSTARLSDLLVVLLDPNGAKHTSAALKAAADGRDGQGQGETDE